MIPAGAISPARTNVLLAVVELERELRTVTVRDVAARVGRSVSATHAQLVSLRRDDLVAWEPGRSATLRSKVTGVALV